MYRREEGIITPTNPGIRISVVIPAYNAAAFLPRCLKSVFAQTLQPDEVIVVDDGSTDGTGALAEELGARVIRQPNRGISAARNAGIRSASGAWIALLDADDLWMPEKLERQVALIQSETVLVYTGIRMFDDSGTRGVRLAVSPRLAEGMLRYCNPISPSTVLAKRDILARDGGFREDICACEDWEMWVRAQHFGEFDAVAEPMAEYYVYPGSLSANPERMIRAMDQILDTTLVADLRGIRRLIWRCRIRAAELSRAGLIARENNLKGELHYMFQSLFAWPSPFWKPRRFALFAVSFRNWLSGEEIVYESRNRTG
jgi:glycosyltransferase involved in cell wall biosynthesis